MSWDPCRVGMRGATSIAAVGLVIGVAVGCSSDEETRRPEPSLPSPVPDATMNLSQPRAVHLATRLPDGRILITGGCTLPGCEGFEEGRRSELFDPRQDGFLPGPTMATPRANGTATLLADGRVLVAGGYPGEGQAPTAHAELFDPEANRFEPIDDMAHGRAGHTATLLPDGRVILCGGVGADGEPLDSTEIFDPSSNTFSPGPRLSEPRAAHVAVRLGDRLILIGGERDSRALSTTDVLTDMEWTPGPTLRVPRVKHAAVALPDGRILVVGGAINTEGRHRLSSTELIDLASGRVDDGPRLSEGMYKLDGAVTSLSDGRVVIAGGTHLDVFDPQTNAIGRLDRPVVPRLSFATATALGGLRVLLAGGYDDLIDPTASARIVTIPRRTVD